MGMADDARRAAEHMKQEESNTAAASAQRCRAITTVLNELVGEFLEAARELGLQPQKSKLLDKRLARKYFRITLAHNEDIKIYPNGDWTLLSHNRECTVSEFSGPSPEMWKEAIQRRLNAWAAAGKYVPPYK
jgi:hypothetical protein